MNKKPFDIGEHLHLKVCYTLDYPFKNEKRQALAEYILSVAMDGETSFTVEAWNAVLDKVISSSLTVGDWLEVFSAESDQKQANA